MIIKVPDTKQYNFMGRLRARRPETPNGGLEGDECLLSCRTMARRIPFLKMILTSGTHQKSVSSMLNRDKNIILENATLTEEQKNFNY